VLLFLLLLPVDLAPSGTRLNTGDSFKSKTDVDNKRHTNAHRPLTSHSPTGVSIPPLSASVGVRKNPLVGSGEQLGGSLIPVLSQLSQLLKI